MKFSHFNGVLQAIRSWCIQIRILKEHEDCDRSNNIRKILRFSSFHSFLFSYLKMWAVSALYNTFAFIHSYKRFLLQLSAYCQLNAFTHIKNTFSSTFLRYESNVHWLDCKEQVMLISLVGWEVYLWSERERPSAWFLIRASHTSCFTSTNWIHVRVSPRGYLWTKLFVLCLMCSGLQRRFCSVGLPVKCLCDLTVISLWFSLGCM